MFTTYQAAAKRSHASCVHPLLRRAAGTYNSRVRGARALDQRTQRAGDDDEEDDNRGDVLGEHERLPSGHNVKPRPQGPADKALYDAYMASEFRHSILSGQVHPAVTAITSRGGPASLASAPSKYGDRPVSGPVSSLGSAQRPVSPHHAHHAHRPGPAPCYCVTPLSLSCNRSLFLQGHHSLLQYRKPIEMAPVMPEVKPIGHNSIASCIHFVPVIGCHTLVATPWLPHLNLFPCRQMHRMYTLWSPRQLRQRQLGQLVQAPMPCHPSCQR